MKSIPNDFTKFLLSLSKIPHCFCQKSAMKLHFEIEYHTYWGEQLVLQIGSRRIELQCVDGCRWMGCIEGNPDEKRLEYHYLLECEGACLRRERISHQLLLPETSGIEKLVICDRWLDRPSDAPFYSTAFTQGIFARQATNPVPQNVGNITLQTSFASLRPDEALAIAGSGRFLQDWQRIIPMDDSHFPEWQVTLPVAESFEYKFLIVNRKTGTLLCWEEGENRRWTAIPAADEHLLDASAVPRIPDRQWRGAGTAIPLFSLRSEKGFGIGEFADLKLLVDWAVATGQKVLQLLPINDTTMARTWEDSYPYNANSSFALHPQFIRLSEVGIVEDEEYCRLREELNRLPALDYERVNRIKEQLLHKAYKTYGAKVAKRQDYRAFVADNARWLMPYAAYSVLRDRFGTADFAQWGAYAVYDPEKIEILCREEQEAVGYYYYVQYHLHCQLLDARNYAHARGVVLKGDLPIGVSRTSCDAWHSPELFRMDSQAGAPPDAFSAAGQNWGFPTYDWERMAQDDYAWWRARLKKMAAYFDAFRIDHLLGFFRIWEIPLHAVHGLLGHFNPALPYSAEELRACGFDLSEGAYTTPIVDKELLAELFGELADEVQTAYTRDGRLIPEYDTQRKVVSRLAARDPHTERLREGLMTLLDDVLFVEDPVHRGFYHPRIAAQSTFAFQRLDERQRETFNCLHDDFFYRRHNGFWRESAMRKLPALLDATGMLACGEDLGMIPDCVPQTMHDLRILSLEIQRMPKQSFEAFADPAHYPYLSVCATSTHDMSPIRAWWREDRELTRRFWCEVLQQRGEAPLDCEPWICQRIIEQHLASPAMFAILPWQDWLAMDGQLRYRDSERERINIPAVPRHYWRYRMHLTLEQLLEEKSFNAKLGELIAMSGRN